MTTHDTIVLTDEEAEALANEVYRTGDPLVKKGGAAFERALVRAAYAKGHAAGALKCAEECEMIEDRHAAKTGRWPEDGAYLQGAAYSAQACAAACRAIAGQECGA
jgi:hypothetical protein